MAGSNFSIPSVHVEQGIEARRWDRFIVNRPGIIVSVNAQLQGLSSRNCQVVDISRGGACIIPVTTFGLPDHYYLTFSGLVERIGCAEVYRKPDRIGVKFIRILPEGLLSQIVRGDFLAGDDLAGKDRQSNTPRR